MKICYLCHADNYHIKKWANALADRGHELHLITFRPYEYDHSSIAVHSLSSIFKRIFYFDFIAIVPKVRRLLEELQPDIVLASFANTYGLTALMAGASPLVIQTWSRDIAAPDSVNRREAWMAHHIGKWILDSADAITTDSRNFADLIKQRWPELKSKILPTPWGIKTQQYIVSQKDRIKARNAFNIPTNAKVLTSIRGVYWYYNPEILLPALKRLIDEAGNEELHLVILTLNQPRTDSIQAFLDKFNEYSNVHVFDRYLPYGELYSIWAATDFFISIPKFDGVSEALQEGRMAGAIPILNDIPANREVAEEDKHAFYINSHDSFKLAEEIKQILDTPAPKLKSMQENNRCWILKNANIDQTLDNLINLFNQLLKL